MRADVVGVARHWDEQAMEEAARHEVNARVRCRLLALRQLALGRTVAQTAGLYALGGNQLYHWIRRFEAQGLAGLKDRPRSGAPQRLARASEAAFVRRVLDGPSADSGLSAWRGEDLRGVLRQEFGAEYSLSGVYALLHRLGLSNLVPRPQHPRSDEAAQAAFKKSARH